MSADIDSNDSALDQGGRGGGPRRDRRGGGEKGDGHHHHAMGHRDRDLLRVQPLSVPRPAYQPSDVSSATEYEEYDMRDRHHARGRGYERAAGQRGAGSGD